MARIKDKAKAFAYSFSPMITMVEYGKAHGTDEVLAAHLSPGNIGASSAKSHIEALSSYWASCLMISMTNTRTSWV